jgi:hypothetical protein
LEVVIFQISTFLPHSLQILLLIGVCWSLGDDALKA